MDSKFIIVTAGVWLLFMVLAIINAGIRNMVYRPIVGDLAAHQISSIVFMAVILAVTYATLKFLNPELSDSEAICMGIIWLIATITFEFTAGHYVFGNPWERLVADYNLFEGRIWSLVLLTLLLAPYAANKIRQQRGSA